MSFSDDLFCATPTTAANSSSRAIERPLPRTALKMRPTRGGSSSNGSIYGISKVSISSPHHHQAKTKLQSQKQRLVKTAPRVPDSFGDSSGDEEFHALPSLPTCRLRMRPSKDTTGVEKTPVQRVSFVPASAPVLEPKSSSNKAPLRPMPSLLPTYLLFPDLPSSGESKRKFILKPKSLTRSCHSPSIAG